MGCHDVTVVRRLTDAGKGGDTLHVLLLVHMERRYQTEPMSIDGSVLE